MAGEFQTLPPGFWPSDDDDDDSKAKKDSKVDIDKEVNGAKKPEHQESDDDDSGLEQVLDATVTSQPTSIEDVEAPNDLSRMKTGYLT